MVMRKPDDKDEYIDYLYKKWQDLQAERDKYKKLLEEAEYWMDYNIRHGTANPERFIERVREALK